MRNIWLPLHHTVNDINISTWLLWLSLWLFLQYMKILQKFIHISRSHEITKLSSIWISWIMTIFQRNNSASFALIASIGIRNIINFTQQYQRIIPQTIYCRIHGAPGEDGLTIFRWRTLWIEFYTASMNRWSLHQGILNRWNSIVDSSLTRNASNDMKSIFMQQTTYTDINTFTSTEDMAQCQSYILKTKGWHFMPLNYIMPHRQVGLWFINFIYTRYIYRVIFH